MSYSDKVVERKLRALLDLMGAEIPDIDKAIKALESNKGVVADCIELPEITLMGLPLVFSDIEKPQVSAYADGNKISYVIEARIQERTEK